MAERLRCFPRSIQVHPGPSWPGSDVNRREFQEGKLQRSANLPPVPLPPRIIPCRGRPAPKSRPHLLFPTRTSPNGGSPHTLCTVAGLEELNIPSILCSFMVRYSRMGHRSISSVGKGRGRVSVMWLRCNCLAAWHCFSCFFQCSLLSAHLPKKSRIIIIHQGFKVGHNTPPPFLPPFFLHFLSACTLTSRSRGAYRLQNSVWS